MYDDILFPTDGSDTAAAAFEHALTLADRFDATLHLLYVVNTRYDDLGPASGATLASLRGTGETVLEEAEVRATEAGVETVTHLPEGDPYEEILGFDDRVDLIVMGTRGRSGLDRYLLGSVTEKVVRTADIPVVTVRGEE